LALASNALATLNQPITEGVFSVMHVNPGYLVRQIAALVELLSLGFATIGVRATLSALALEVLATGRRDRAAWT
jgi:hypothetical protein